MSSTTTTQPSTDRGAGATVELRGLRRTFGDVNALDGLDITMAPGEFVALLGPSGCGKTTALRALAGFEQVDAGAILVDGQDVSQIPANKRDMGMVFQAYSLFPNLTAQQNVEFGLRMRKQAKATRAAKATELLELVGLAPQANRYAFQMSGGQQQRVALARALAVAPRVLLLDEPLSALDAKVRASLRDEIRRVQTTLGITTLFVTHDQEEALSIADRVGVMRNGRLEQIGPPDQVYGRPATEFVADFVGAMNSLPGVMDAGGLVSVLGQGLRVSDPAGLSSGQSVTAFIRPETVRVVAAPGGNGTVTARSFLGSVTRVTVDVDGAGSVMADLSSLDAIDLVIGTPVQLRVSDVPVLVRTR